MAPLTQAQKDGIAFAIKNSYSICAMDMGLGKSRNALEVSRMLGVTTLIVCPSHLVLTWQAEINKWLGHTKQISVIKKKSEIYSLWDTDIAIISIENISAADILFEWARLVILDEGHYIKNMEAKRTQTFHRLVYENNIERLMVLTGTPIKNRVEEYFSLLSLCNYNPKLKEQTFLERFPDRITFADYFSNREEYEMDLGPYKSFKVIKWSGYKNEKELKQWLAPIYYRAKGDPGKITYKEVIINLGEDEELAEELESMGLGENTVAGPAKQMAAMQLVPDTIKYATEIIDECGQLIIYSDFKEPARLIATALGVDVITGDTAMEARFKIARKFQAGEIKIIVATIKSFSTGVTLTAANNMIFNDPCWSPGDLKQAEFRINRLGQTKLCVIHRMIGSVQGQKIYEVLQDKMKTIEVVT